MRTKDKHNFTVNNIALVLNVRIYLDFKKTQIRITVLFIHMNEPQNHGMHM